MVRFLRERVVAFRKCVVRLSLIPGRHNVTSMLTELISTADVSCFHGVEMVMVVTAVDSQGTHGSRARRSFVSQLTLAFGEVLLAGHTQTRGIHTNKGCTTAAIDR